MTNERGEVWWGPAPHKSSPSYRPWVVVSDETHPFSQTECIALAMTTQEHEGAIRVASDGWRGGGSNKQSYISPWYVTTIKYRDFDRQQGKLTEDVVSRAVKSLFRYVPEESQ